MKNRTKLLSTAFISAALVGITACNPQAQRSEEEIQEIVKSYLMENPQVILESVEQAQIKEKQAEIEKASASIEENLAQLENDVNSPFLGDIDAKNVIVEFFDYNCGYCKRAVPTILAAHKQIKDVKIVFKELPILGPSSEQMSRAALVVHRKYPERYMDFHSALMAHKGPRTPEAIEQIAKDIALPPIDFKTETKTKEIADIIAANRKLAQDIGVRGTPAFVINGQFVPGAVDIDRIKSVIEKK